MMDLFIKSSFPKDSTLETTGAMPPGLRSHFFTLESNLICEKLWQISSSSGVLQLLDFCQKVFPPLLPGAGHVSETAEANMVPGAKSAIAYFVNRMGIHLIYRINLLCQKQLRLPEATITHITEIMHFVIMHKYRELLVNRHLDTMLLCSTYIAMRLGHQQPKFKSIINAFKNEWPTCTSTLWREIPNSCQETQKTLNIIEFYNDIFVAELKPRVFITSPTPGKTVSPEKSNISVNDATTPPEKKLKVSSNLYRPNQYQAFQAAYATRFSSHDSMTSPVRVSNTNLYLSPMRQQTIASLSPSLTSPNRRKRTLQEADAMSPRTQLISSFNESPMTTFNHPYSAPNSPPPPPPSTTTMTTTTNTTTQEDGKRHCSNFMTRRLQQVDRD